MKFITNILLILAIVCYVFLPFATIELANDITGLQYSAGLVTEDFSLWHTLFALLPFIATFGAIGLNCLKSRWWGLAVGILILADISFLGWSHIFADMPLSHDPDLESAAPQEGLKIAIDGIGYTLSNVLCWLALASCFVSMLPFKFNMVIEQRIDASMERGKQGLSKMGHELHDEIAHHQPHRKSKSAATPPPAPQQEQAPAKRQERPEDYMPADQRPAAPEQQAPQQPAQPASDEERYRDYMPK